MTTTSTGTTKPDYTPRQKRLIERYREFNVDHDWWDFTYDGFVEKAAAKGFVTETDKMRFSGFWSQGDGASFTGYVNVAKFIAYVKAENAALVAEGKTAPLDPYPWISKLLEAGGDVSVTIDRDGYHYVHENTCRATVDRYDRFRWFLPTEDETRDAVIEAWDTALDADIGHLEEDIESVRLDLCRELYKSLEDEHDYLTSDDAVWDAIEANELDQEEEDDDGTTEG